jgi:hypothetical protein
LGTNRANIWVLLSELLLGLKGLGELEKFSGLGVDQGLELGDVLSEGDLLGGGTGDLGDQV